MNASLNGGEWHTFLDHLDLVSKIIVSGARLSPRIFEAGIQNLVCGCILEWRSVVYHFGVTWTSDLVSTIIISRAYLLYHLR